MLHSSPKVSSDLLTCLSLSPATLQPVGIAMATIQAGGIGLLDWELVGSKTAIAEQNLRKLITIADEYPGETGVRISADQTFPESLQDFFQNSQNWLILTNWDHATQSQSLKHLLADCKLNVLLEISNIKQLQNLSAWSGVSGLIARGQESGGWSSADSTFVLTQKLVKAVDLPVYAQGGIGVHTAAACRAIGAAGVILDDQLWLMPESPLSGEWQKFIANSNGQEAALIGEQTGWGCRVFARPGLKAVEQLKAIAEEIEVTITDPEQRWQTWREKAQPLLGWDESGEFAWPMGQTISLAAGLRDRYRTTGRAIQAISQVGQSHLAVAQKLPILSPDAPLAQSHNTRYPIMQGPMTRVSDCAGFAKAVAEGGALPMLALALMKGEQVLKLLQETKAMIGDRSWGIGILGFVPQDLRKVQLEAVRQVKPPFALIAGGRPDQAKQLESEGIATYLHVPTPALLKLFLSQGVSRFVFEGRECGGHVGPLSSFVLWNNMVETLLSDTPAELVSQTHVLFAGGIHDAESAAMVAAMAAPLAERGMKVGVLMGSAYLFTEEAVRDGAIGQPFQQVILDCRETVNLETGPGHANRCAITPFAQEFQDLRKRLIQEQRSVEDIREALDSLTIGRLRVATKGLVRTEEGIVPVDTETQKQDGMYMIGQVATLRSDVITIAELHETVSVKSTALLQEASVPQSWEVLPTPSPADVAIIGIGTLLPKAQNPEAFWENIIEKVNCLSEIPETRWDWRLYFNSDPQARDKIYSKWGAFLDDVPFDPLKFGIPPTALRSIEPLQLLTLETVRLALENAGYADGNFDREHTSVILGAGGGIGDLGSKYAARSEIHQLMGDPGEPIWERFPEWTEDSFPGLLLNVAAGRVANRFNFGGSNFTVDAACGSSLAAIHLATRELENGTSNVAIAGGIDTNLSPFSYLCFSKTHALSPNGQPRPFDQSADGIVISEGLAVIVMKRLADAKRDGDRVYGVLKASAGSSDGRALSMTAPHPTGQRRALDRVYRKAGISPKTLGLYEAHGTGTAAGDRAELETITKLLQDNQAQPKSCAIGSVKSLIGHTKSSAGVTGLIKAVLGLYHKVLPPHYGVETPLPPIANPENPAYLLTEPRPWFAHPDYPRRAAVSAFGFGGTNYHILLEEDQADWRQPEIGGKQWPAELFLLQAPTREALLEKVTWLQSVVQAGTHLALGDLAYTLTKAAQREGPQKVCVGLVVQNRSELAQTLAQLAERLRDPSSQTPLPQHIQLGEAADQSLGKLAILFPGQSSQFVNMGQETALYLEELRSSLEFADATLASEFPKPLSQIIYPPASFSEAETQAQDEALRGTGVTQPAIGTLAMGYLNFVKRLGIAPEMAAGHSYGEYSALHAAGVLSAKDFLLLSKLRGQVMAEGCLHQEGRMAAIMLGEAALQPYLQQQPNVTISNLNSPKQSVISGPRVAIEQVVAALKADGVKVKILSVAGAFHSSQMLSVQQTWIQSLEKFELSQPQFPVYANVNAAPHSDDPAAMRSLLAEHLVQPVRFQAAIEAMYEAGARVFLELSPRSLLSNLVAQILPDQDYLTVSLGSYEGGMRGLLIALAHLATKGVEMDLTALYRDRSVKALDYARLLELAADPPLSPTTWMLSGARVRKQSEKFEVLPPVELETLVPGRSSTPVAETGNGHQEQPSPPKAQTPMAPSRSVSEGSPSKPKSYPVPQSYNGVQHPTMNQAQSTNTALAAYQTHQETMRQFLASEERLLHHLFDQNHGGQSYQPQSPQFTTASPIPQRSLQSSPNGHGKDPAPQPIARATPTRSLSASSQPKAPYSPTPTAPAKPPIPEPQAPPTPPAQSQPVASPQKSAATTELTQESLTEKLLSLVSDLTGYPTEVLSVDQDIEAELGIDSIKRVEILGALEKELPETLTEQVRAKMDDLTQVKTFNRLVEAILKLSPTATEEANRLGKPKAGADSVPRYVTQVQTHAAIEDSLSALTGFYWVTEDDLGIAPKVVAAIREKGGQAEVLPQSTLRSLNALTEEWQTLRSRYGAMSGLIHLTALSANAPTDIDAWRDRAFLDAKRLFTLLQLNAEEALKMGQFRVVSASLLGGAFGRNQTCGPGPVTGGAHNGLLKTLVQEWAGVQATAIDCDSTQSPESLVQQIVQELCANSPVVEVGYPQGQRTYFDSVLKPLSPTAIQLQPASDWVVLVTGGSRGITAEVMKSFMVPGMTLIILGRSSEPAPESPATEGISDVNELRRILLNSAKAEGKPTTPAQVEKSLQTLLKARVSRQNLQWFRAQGHVEYHAIDVRDAVRFGSFLDGIYERYGRLDAVIHGAGIIEDKLIVNKQADSLDRVFDTKADSAFILSQHLQPESLKLLAFFASVAGRFGNRGQGDYGATNEVVTRLAWHLDQSWSNTRVIAFQWGPWETTGMASEMIQRQFKERGIIPIPLAAGTQFFVEEVLYGKKGEVEVIVGEGPWTNTPSLTALRA